jgi:phosphate transport system substrate-binding protein
MSSVRISVLRCLGVVSLVSVMAALTACGGGQTGTQAAGDDQAGTDKAAGSGQPNLQGKIVADGSSTVFPISEAMAEEFMKANSGVNVSVGTSGTGGGFKKFCGGETDISNASRPIKKKEADLCAQKKIEFVELPIAYDAVAVITNKDNTWAKCLKTSELKKMWEPAAQGKVKSWKDIRADFPAEPLALFGPGTDSGTFDYFTDAINGKEGASRGDYTASEDDNVLVQGVSGSKGGIGYLGLAYYEQNKDKLGLVSIDDGKADDGAGCIAPSEETVTTATYQPLARPVFIYVKKESLKKPEVKAFVDFQMNAANKELVSEAGYIGLPDEFYPKLQARVSSEKVGSVFPGGSAVGVKLADLLAKE